MGRSSQKVDYNPNPKKELIEVSLFRPGAKGVTGSGETLRCIITQVTPEDTALPEHSVGIRDIPKQHGM